ncbi:hypothetical protein OG401_23975 [Kitasatospora purpeofusca]|uniref:hypothetical protein n=1 Tax=Kitasatospora purpeofusca TaxID=67352 RepID=UPI00224ED096|nr:hypothetical protein [Kitasatospora purpeofusca]MCX4687323.1 hypothetical protein [Kitasatospora purpeofusca]
MKVTTVRKADGTYDYKIDGVRGGASTLTPWGARVQGLRAVYLIKEREETGKVYRLQIQPITGTMTMNIAGEHDTKVDAWKAVQETFYADPVTILENDKPVASFLWFRTYEEVPSQSQPGRVAQVWRLYQWGKRDLGPMLGGWGPTEVEYVYDGRCSHRRKAVS